MQIEYYKSLLQLNTKIFEEKYYSIEKYVAKVTKHIFDFLKTKNNLKNGLDFGCGLAVPTIVGKELGYNIIGIDTTFDNGKTDYADIHSKMIQDGYPIDLFNTFSLPWKQYENSSKDFIHSSWSLWANHEKEAVCEDDIILSRLKEFIRIVRPEGFLIIRVPNMYIKRVSDMFDSVKEKNINLRLIEDNTTLGPRFLLVRES